MVIIEFTETVQKDGFGLTETRKIYFVGRGVEDIMADTKNGTEFALLCKMSPPRQISIEEARRLDLDSLEAGISSITDGTSKSFYLGAVKE